MRGRFLKKLKPDEKMAPSLSIQEIHSRSSENACQPIGPCLGALTFDEQVQDVAD